MTGRDIILLCADLQTDVFAISSGLYHDELMQLGQVSRLRDVLGLIPERLKHDFVSSALFELLGQLPA